MTHTQTQGADGAGTKTAGIGPRTITTSRQTCAGCPALQTKEWTFYGENDDIDSGTDGKCTAAGKVISGYWSERAPTPDWCPAPAATPGVPDSVREAFEAAELHECWVNADKADVMTNPYGHCGNFDQVVARCATGELWQKRAVAIARSLNWVRALIAAQPAGQAGDAGERWRCPECGCREYARVDQRQPGGNFAPGPLVRCVECKDVFNAPNSTRTGAAETEETVAKALYRHDYGSYPDQPEWDAAPASVQKRYRALSEAALAARPEAPSDAGWNFDMEAAPQDGTRILLWMHGCWIHPVIGYRAPSAPGSQRDCWREHGSRARIHRADCWRLIPAGPTPPSDPAPSGQAEG